MINENYKILSTNRSSALLINVYHWSRFKIIVKLLNDLYITRQYYPCYDFYTSSELLSFSYVKGSSTSKSKFLISANYNCLYVPSFPEVPDCRSVGG